ncbi:unnamed protein product [Lactuca virosa]|uniref:F-box domain-containing protein n=3 Tax=Lactuca virosa TaxID=75947 RepID=A0AAU9N075_9ASTR|nr:unnamed protein product [Lactuca virosa]CAH1430384.1 unnamed protein product [Lactuca virosa]
MEKLPGDVLSNIFIRLLAKQLAQMRLVCKTWNALLSESSFIKSHLHHSIHNNKKNKDDEILLFFEKAIIDYFSSTCPLTARSCGSPRLEVSNFMKLELPIDPQHEKKKPMINVFGSVNGLICFSYLKNHGYFIRIWNPSLSASLTLPRSSLSDQTHHPYVWFGFDPKTDDYKVVKVSSSFFFLKPADRETQPHPQVEVYSMRKGSWESASQRIPSHIKMFFYRDDVCVDGRIHWLCVTDLEGNPRTIVTFDLGAMTLGDEIPLPDSVIDCGRWCMSDLGVLGGKLCVMSRCVKHYECNVWVRDDHTDSWVKHHLFSQFNARITPYGFTSHNEFLFQLDHSPRFALYDPVAAKTKTFKIKTMTRPLDRLKIFNYVDSLAWIPPAATQLSSVS